MTFCSEVQTEPLAGSAKQSSQYVLVEHTQPWGDDIKTTLSSEQLAIIDQLPTTYLIRKPGRAGHQPVAQRNVYVVDALAGTITHHLIADFEELLELPAGTPATQPLLMVCTHAKRDRCCAIKGRPIAAALAQEFPDAPIWECSHTKGHRFAPSMILMPWGYSFGRIDVPTTIAMYQAAQRGELFLPGNRGNGIYSAAEQVVELAVAQHLLAQGKIIAMGDIQVSGTTATAYGQSYEVALEQHEAMMLPSCGKPEKAGKYYTATQVYGEYEV